MSEIGLSRTATEHKNIRKKRKQSGRLKTIFLIIVLSFLFCMVSGMTFLFATQTGTELREWMAGTLLTTQHDYWAPYTFLPKSKLDELRREIENPESINSAPLPSPATETVARVVDPTAASDGVKNPAELVEIEDIDENRGTYFFKGKIMTISDPNRVHLIVTKRKDRGDLLGEYAKKYNTLGIVNASGFHDPDGYGRGQKANGLVIHDGKILQSYPKTGGDTSLAITYDGKLITGKYSAQELIDMGVRDAMSFRPQLIVNGKNLFANQNGKSWGIQPRTAIGQKADGSIVFVVIDGRQPEHSIGASMKDVADLLESKGVVTAMAMDGGSSSMMLHKNEAITKTACPYPPGRFLPNAWAVY